MHRLLIALLLVIDVHG